MGGRLGAASWSSSIASKWQIRRVANLKYPPRAEAFRLRSREDIMKATYWIIAAAAFAFVQPAPASAGVNDQRSVILAANIESAGRHDVESASAL
jgi:hypothetical protein